jgi:fatty acid-binding protein DegV
VELLGCLLSNSKPARQNFVKELDTGKDFSEDEVANRIRDDAFKVQCYFMIDTMQYLYVVGRCTGYQNLVSGMLKIKQIFKVEDGNLM